MALSRSRLVFALGAAALVPVVVACNAIVGLDDYKRTECGAFPCPFDGGTDAPDVFVPDGGKDAAPDAPPGVGPTSWPEFLMPNYKGDAGLVAPNPLSYQLVADAVEDTVTGLVWKTAVVGNGFGTDYNLADARSECAKLANGPWRLPKRIELVTLLSHGQGPQFVDRAVFQGVNKVKVWTSSEVRPLTAGAQKYWVVDFNEGKVDQQLGTDPAKALCVKGK